MLSVHSEISTIDTTPCISLSKVKRHHGSKGSAAVLSKKATLPRTSDSRKRAPQRPGMKFTRSMPAYPLPSGHGYEYEVDSKSKKRADPHSNVRLPFNPKSKSNGDTVSTPKAIGHKSRGPLRPSSNDNVAKQNYNPFDRVNISRRKSTKLNKMSKVKDIQSIDQVDSSETSSPKPPIYFVKRGPAPPTTQRILPPYRSTKTPQSTGKVMDNQIHAQASRLEQPNIVKPAMEESAVMMEHVQSRPCKFGYDDNEYAVYPESENGSIIYFNTNDNV